MNGTSLRRLTISWMAYNTTMECNIMLLEKIDMFLLAEAKSGAKLTPLGASVVNKLKGISKEDVDKLVAHINSKVNDGKMYEISFDIRDRGDKTPIIINRRGDDVIKNKITPEVHKEYREAVEDFLKGTGFKIVGELKSADWLAFKVS